MNDRPDIVEVDWLDSIGDSGWHSRARAERDAEDADALVHHTCGYLLADERGYVLIAQSWREESEGSEEFVGDTIQIPRVAILNGPTVLHAKRRR